MACLFSLFSINQPIFTKLTAKTVLLWSITSTPFSFEGSSCLQICPVCAKKVGINMAVHIITQHGSILNISFLFSSECALDLSMLFSS